MDHDEPPVAPADPTTPPDSGTPPEPPSRAPAARRPAIVLAVAVALVALSLVGLIALGALGGQGGDGATDPGGSAGPSSRPDADFSARGRALGVADAPVTVEVWADFQCPFCRLSAHGTEPAIVREFAATGAARIVFRDFAFLGQELVDAAVAARCAERQDRFWRYHDLLFASQAGENQGAFARPNLEGLARFAGLDSATFSACLDDATIAEAVAAETAEGRGLGVDSTPTIRVVGPNGTQLLTGLNAPDAVADVIERGGRAAPTATASPAVDASPSGLEP